MSDHSVHNTPYDGDCAYRSFLRCVRSDWHYAKLFKVIQKSEDAAVQNLRNRVAHVATWYPQFMSSILDLCDIIKAVPEVIEDYDFMKYAGGPHGNLFLYKATIATTKNFASEIELNVLAAMAEGHGIQLVILDAPSTKLMIETWHIEKQLACVLKTNARMSKLIILVHVEDLHYMYLSIDNDKIIDITRLQEYVDSLDLISEED